MLFVIIPQINSLNNLESFINSREVNSNDTNTLYFYDERQNKMKCLKNIIKNADIIRSDSIDLHKLSKISNIVFQILMYDSSVNEILHSVFKVQKNLDNEEMKNLERKFELNVILFLISRNHKIKSREVNKFIQALAFGSYKLIYYLSLTYKIKNKADKVILKYSLRNNIELKIDLECNEKITQVFNGNVVNETIKNKILFYKSELDEKNYLTTTENYISDHATILFEPNEDNSNNKIVDACINSICE
ncbi:uncharacterized protein VNE69_09006 [Vairimorpha necatrix]|uniref:Uncharacterized protein n=1 Tax=Vairimorpha necatrix TaxID=6039 RepID=A0AAX4JEQ5_9MICR